MITRLPILFCVLLLSFGCSRPYSRELETDGVLIEYFRDHRHEFDQIAAACHSHDVWQTIALLKGLKREGVCLRNIPGPHDLLIRVSPQTDLTKGDINVKALAWCERNPPGLVEDLDKAPDEFGRYYRHIQDHWYLFLQSSKKLE